MEYVVEISQNKYTHGIDFFLLKPSEAKKEIPFETEPESHKIYCTKKGCTYVIPENYDNETLRMIGANIVDYSIAHSFSEINIGLGFLNQSEISAFLDGIYISSYYFELKQKQKQKALKIGITDLTYSLDELLITKRKVFNSVNLVRDLVNYPANICTIEYFIETVKKIFENRNNIKITILEEKDLERLGMNGIIAVGKGSVNRPKMLIIEYTPLGDKTEKNKPAFDVALIGKGVIFDSGGLSLKPAKYMETMKEDMAGAATVVGTILAASDLEIKKNILGITPLVENMPSGSATKPGDVITTYTGKTVEIVNTDAEGRIILADALGYAYAKYSAKKVIDLATLTGACVVALGPLAAGILGNDQELINQLIECGEKTGERIWQLPLWEDYKEFIKSKIADIKNVGLEGGYGGVMAGASFLNEFTNNKNWAHLDIAPVAYHENKVRYYRFGATGFGVRLLLDYLQRE